MPEKTISHRTMTVSPELYDRVTETLERTKRVMAKGSLQRPALLEDMLTLWNKHLDKLEV